MNKHLSNELKQWVHFWKKFTFIILTKGSSVTSIQNDVWSNKKFTGFLREYKFQNN